MLVLLQAKESDFLGGKGPFIERKKECTVRESNQLEV